MVSLQVVIVPCGVNEQSRRDLFNHCHTLASTLSEVGLRVKADLREYYRPGWKFNDWELKVLHCVECSGSSTHLHLCVITGGSSSTGGGSS